MFGQFFRYVHDEQDANQPYGFNLTKREIKSQLEQKSKLIISLILITYV